MIIPNNAVAPQIESVPAIPLPLSTVPPQPNTTSIITSIINGSTSGTFHWNGNSSMEMTEMEMVFKSNTDNDYTQSQLDMTNIYKTRQKNFRMICNYAILGFFVMLWMFWCHLGYKHGWTIWSCLVPLFVILFLSKFTGDFTTAFIPEHM